MALRVSLQADIAARHTSDRVQVQYQAQRRIGELWGSASTHDLDGSWEFLAPRLVQLATSAQVASAALATPYMDAVDRSYGNTPPQGDLAPESFGGVMLDGREVGPAMYTAVTTTKTGIGLGMAPYEAFLAGANALMAVVGAAVQDMGRQADITLGQARTYTRYVRVVGGSACSRCAILAGMWSGETAFLRHTCCQCTAMPVEVTRSTGKESFKVPSGFHDSPASYFTSLSKAEQDKTFTKAGAEAIRHGADPIKVVNARRGAYGIGYSGHYNIPVPVGTHNTLQRITIGRKPDGSPLQVFATTEGTTARGAFGKSQLAVGPYQRTKRIRLMPEQLVRMAGTDSDRLRELLTQYGYMY